MKCNRCGHESDFDFIFCPTCGYETPTAPVSDNPDTRVSANPVYHHLTGAFSDSLFLLLSILMTAHCGITLLSGSGFNIISILLTVFLWLVYSSAKNGTIDSAKIKNISGTVYANYIVLFVVSILLIVSSAMLLMSGGIISASDGLITPQESEEILNEMPSYFTSLVDFNTLSDMSLFFVIMSIAMGIVSIGMLLFTIFGIRRIHRFVKSVYQCLDAGYMSYENANGASGWLIFFGIVEVISALSTSAITFGKAPLTTIVTAALSSALYGAALIVAGAFIKKHFANPEQL